jgi:hypothetical protein
LREAWAADGFLGKRVHGTWHLEVNEQGIGERLEFREIGVIDFEINRLTPGGHQQNGYSSINM